MSSIPNLEAGRKKAVAETSDELTVACVACKRPLWAITNIKRYGTRVSSDKKAYPGVREYDDVWKREGQGFVVANEDCLCPFCGEPFMRATKVGEHIFPVPFVLEL